MIDAGANDGLGQTYHLADLALNAITYFSQAGAEASFGAIGSGY